MERANSAAGGRGRYGLLAFAARACRLEARARVWLDALLYLDALFSRGVLLMCVLFGGLLQPPVGDRDT